MFEKEAEEYSNNWKINKKYKWNFAELVELRAVIYKAHKDGAEFGYNLAKEEIDYLNKHWSSEEERKANEWLYPSKGEYPKDEKNMLMSEQLILLTKLKGTNNLSISIGQYNFSTLEFSYPHIVGLTDVYAWKEIVLPELPKESE